ncbi:MAG: RNA polymerase sigma factor [Steroidobacteraceae bacterium]
MVGFDRAQWFARQILVHEAPLRGYLRRFLKCRSDVADGIQETYARLLGLPDATLEAIRHPHAFLFTTARNVALEWKRRERIISRDLMAESASSSVLDNRPSAYEELSAREELALLARAVAALPPRCREVLTLRKLYGVPQKEIAMRLGISENTVEKHSANGVRLCARYIEAPRNAADRPPFVRSWFEKQSVRAQGRDRGERVDRQARRPPTQPRPSGTVRALALREPAP